MRKEVRIAGFGGQGVILAGVILAQAAGAVEGREVAQTQSYGPEARGGAARCDVVISDQRILYPKVRRPDILLAMSGQALAKFGVGLDVATGKVVVDSTFISEIPEGLPPLYRLPATRLAEEEFKNRIVANMVMLGALARVDGAVAFDSLKRAVAENVAPKFRDLNLAAMDRGYQAVEGPGLAPAGDPGAASASGGGKGPVS